MRVRQSLTYMLTIFHHQWNIPTQKIAHLSLCVNEIFEEVDVSALRLQVLNANDKISSIQKITDNPQ